MFTGIIETVGIINHLQMINNHMKLIIEPQMKFNDLSVGDNVSVNGVCLTVTNVADDSFYVTAVPQTVNLTNLKNLTFNSRVNLERSVKLNSRIEGHTVQGHVDATGVVESINTDGSASLIVKIKVPTDILKYIVKKGCIALDGMSTTVFDIVENYLTVSLIPFSRKLTIINQYKPSTLINIEVDIFAKYVERIMRSQLYA